MCLPCGAVLLCDAVRCCYSKCHTTGTTAVRTRYYNTLNHKKMLSSQLSPAITQQRSAAPCGAVRCRAVPCLALRCSAVLRCALFRTRSSTRYHAIPGTDRYVCTCVILFFSLSLFDCPLLVLLFFPSKVHPYWQSERDIANKHTRHNTGQSALRVEQLLALSNC